MSDWIQATLGRCVAALDAGVSVNAEDRPHRAGEIGVLKTSALSGYVFRPTENKAVLPAERRLATESVLADSVLVSRMNTPALVGESCYVEEAHETLFLPDRIWQLKLISPGAASMRWLSYVLQSAQYRRYIEVHATGTSGSMKNLPKSALLALPVCYPDVPEQTQIATVLSALDTAIHQTEAVIEKLKQIKQGLLHDLLRRGVDANGELRPSYEQAPDLYQESPEGWIPKEWTPSSIGDLGEWRGGSTPSKSIKRFWPDDGLLWVSPKDLRSTVIFDTEDKISEVARQNSGLHLFEEGSVVVVFRSGILRHTLPVVKVRNPFTVNQDLKGLIVRPGIDKDFVHHLLQGHARAILNESVKIGTTVESLDFNVFKAFKLRLPDEHEQARIVQRVAAIERLIDDESDALRKTKQQKAGLMDDLLTGRVRVTPLLAQ